MNINQSQINLSSLKYLRIGKARHILNSFFRPKYSICIQILAPNWHQEKSVSVRVSLEEEKRELVLYFNPGLFTVMT